FGPLDACENRLRKGEGNGCSLEEILERQKLDLNRELVGYLGGVLIDAGADTTKSFLQCLVLALLTFPAAQRKAHKEIDRIIRAHRIPSLGFESLPYLSS
ncbi:hypothetical protein C8J56DRAFT_738323, partial [Mycena floridula]